MSGYTAATYAVMAAAAAYSAYSTVQSGKQQQLNADAQADQAELDAKTEKSAAMVQADRIRKLARIQQGEATSALAASGVDVGEGTALNINREIYENAEEDAILTVFGGNNRAQRLTVDAKNTRMAGNQARSNSYGQAASTLLSTGASMYSGWKSSGGVNTQGQGQALTSNPAYVRNM
ncbi:hypothetical protein [Ectopseudomonas alcaliphila]|uniref:Phage protein n=1 Tax=Ectopseudomonas alcaliphila TaxID=101564 RepID=A0A1G7JGE2_9GAMM|nr:hypothetical protein [Pseudomonas alcaliphila]MDX5990473.1 hypothetical protein [Pseudomonas alcaliphila]MDX5995443.1 hypothetical protein [Pseudomonas alcaliphila]MDX5995488.1 hypothetical protein [Pseudomonas alcaliphila]SDF24007.1 hypothetical protein SAMN05216575_106223 [Pseudomonas alcaliphila]